MILMKSKVVRVLGRTIGFLVLLYMPSCGSAQSLQPVRNPPSIHVFGTYNLGSSDFGVNHSAGYGIGGYVQSLHLWGGELRGSYQRWGYQERRYDAVFGPRIVVHRGRFSPYGEFLGGTGHQIKWHHNDPLSFHSNTGGEWKVLGGVDFYAGHHYSVRFGEVAFSRLYVFQGVSAVDFTAGVVYRIPVERWERR